MTRKPPRSKPRRRVSNDANRRSLLLFVEGRKTEPTYLTHWHRRHRKDILVTIAEFHGVPLSLAKRACQQRATEKRAKQEGRPHDEIWCVFDRDDHVNIEEALRLCASNEIKVAFSNPCIELWFQLHFTEQTAHLSRRQAQRNVKDHVNIDKEVSETAFVTLRDRYERARGRAQALDRKHHDDGSPIGSNPSSTVWRLIDSIRRVH